MMRNSVAEASRYAVDTTAESEHNISTDIDRTADWALSCNETLTN